jgi:hypothetical protein
MVHSAVEDVESNIGQAYTCCLLTSLLLSTSPYTSLN